VSKLESGVCVAICSRIFRRSKNPARTRTSVMIWRKFYGCTAVRQNVCSCCVTPCKEMRNSHFMSATDLNHLAHLQNTPFWGFWGPDYAHWQARFFSGHWLFTDACVSSRRCVVRWQPLQEDIFLSRPTTILGNYQLDSVGYGYRQYRLWIPF